MYIKIYARAYCPNLLCFFNWKTWFYIVVLILMMILFVFKLVKYRFRFESLKLKKRLNHTFHHSENDAITFQSKSNYFQLPFLHHMQLSHLFQHLFRFDCSIKLWNFFGCSTKAIQKRVNLWIFFGRERLAKKEMSFI